ncbi:MAG: glycoside hydrolase family 13 protein, partial [Chloroflexi bacterium]|nr:glycoside hydrolase family 13 protein [Chloroflexota bacterium]
NLPALPKFNTDTPAVREYLLGVGEHWVRQGIDGWRLDVPMEIDDEAFWQAFRRRVKTVNAEAYIVGEIWDPAPDWLRGDRFDAVMNYVFSRACLGFCGGDTLNTHRMRHGPYRLTPLGAQALSNRIDAMLDLYDWPVMLAQLNLLGSHDTPRTVTLFNGDTTRLKLAFFYQMTAPGAPCIYYGDEVGLTGGGDPACRKAMPWDESQWDAGLRDHVRRCVALRHRHPALRRGDYTRLYARRGVYAFARRCEDETLVVVLNNDEAGEINIPLRGCLPNGTVLRPVWPASDEVVMVERGRLHGGRIAARSGAAWSVIG